MKNTTETSKKGLITYLEENLTNVSNTLVDQINAVVKLGNKATLDELRELAKEVAVDILSGGATTPQVENEVKPKKTLGKKKTVKEEPKEVKPDVKVTPAKEVKAEEPKETPKETPKEVKPKAEKPKSDGKKEAKEQEPVVKATINPSKKGLDVVNSFPASLDTPLGTLDLNLDTKTMADLYKDYEKGVTNIFAVYWNKRQLKQFDYDILMVNKTAPKSFPNDLDLVQPIYISEDGKILYAVSIYSEVLYAFKASDLDIDEETNIRYINGAEYQVYTVKEQ